ncbi:MAG: DNA polymerase [Candidatus Saccharibacteria bacterium]
MQDLANNFKLPGKTNSYNPAYSDLDMFKGNPDILNQFKDYSLADSVALYRILTHAQKLYISKYTIDIATCYSTASLALKIYRKNFMLVDSIPTLGPSVDAFVRHAYIGGATDYYYKYGENLRYYDVNSLYPHAQCKEIPYEILGYKNKIESLDNFFGFCFAEVSYYGDNPMLPLKVDGNTIFPCPILMLWQQSIREGCLGLGNGVLGSP